MLHSQDTDEKVYVQHRIAEHSKEFNEWLQKVLRFTFVVMKTYGERCTSSYPQCFSEKNKTYLKKMLKPTLNK